MLSVMQSKYFNSTVMFDNDNKYVKKANKDNDSDDGDSPLWMTLMDQSQLVMTIIGLIANMATTLVLIKNGQVGVPLI